MRPEAGQSPPERDGARPRLRITVPPTCALLKRLVGDVTAPWNSASVTCPAVEEIVKWIEIADVPRPAGSGPGQGSGPVTRAADRRRATHGAATWNDADSFAFCTYGPAQTPSVALSTKVCRCAAVELQAGRRDEASGRAVAGRKRLVLRPRVSRTGPPCSARRCRGCSPPRPCTYTSDRPSGCRRRSGSPVAMSCSARRRRTTCTAPGSRGSD